MRILLDGVLEELIFTSYQEPQPLNTVTQLELRLIRKNMRLLIVVKTEGFQKMMKTLRPPS